MSDNIFKLEYERTSFDAEIYHEGLSICTHQDTYEGSSGHVYASNFVEVCFSKEEAIKLIDWLSEKKDIFK